MNARDVYHSRVRRWQKFGQQKIDEQEVREEVCSSLHRKSNFCLFVRTGDDVGVVDQDVEVWY